MELDYEKVKKQVAEVKLLLEKEKISVTLKASLQIIFLFMEAIASKLFSKATSKTSNLSPSQDPHRVKQIRRKSDKKAGGQAGHEGQTLELVKNPDEVIQLKIDRNKLPKNRKWKRVGYSRRQVFDYVVTRKVTEYQAEIYEDEDGNRYEAEYPEGIRAKAQYGSGTKAQVVYLNVEQLLPYERLTNHFADELMLPISQGTVANTIKTAFVKLEKFEDFLKEVLLLSKLIHSDETGININSKNHWIHTLSNEYLTLLCMHQKRGTQAFEAIGVLKYFKGYLVHDGLKAYFTYKNCIHILCNAHHLRELEWVIENSKSTWAKELKDFLILLSKEDEEAIKNYKNKYNRILELAETESPEVVGQRKQSKERNLIKRLIKYKKAILTFVELDFVPFTNNQAERDLRMVKVHQKVSGCFRSQEGAQYYCRIKSFLSTCKKNEINLIDALRDLFNGNIDIVIKKIKANLKKVDLNI